MKRRIMALLISLFILMPVPGALAELADGIYEATAPGMNGDVTARAVVLDGKIAMITAKHDESAEVGAPAIDELIRRAIDVQDPDVDIVTGATQTSEAFVEAMKAALTQAGWEEEDFEKYIIRRWTPSSETTPESEAAGLSDGTYHIQKTTDFSTIDVGITVDGGKITDTSVTSAALEGQVDLLTDDIRNAWARQIVEKQAVDAVSGVTISSNAVQEAVGGVMVQATGGSEAAADDGRIAELEAALADAEARAEAAEAKATEAEAKMAETEAKVAELEAAAAVVAVPGALGATGATGEAGPDTVADAADDTDSVDISRFVRPRPVNGTEAAETATEEASAASENPDISSFTRPRPATGTEVHGTVSEETPATDAPDITLYVRPRRVTGN